MRISDRERREPEAIVLIDRLENGCEIVTVSVGGKILEGRFITLKAGRETTGLDDAPALEVCTISGARSVREIETGMLGRRWGYTEDPSTLAAMAVAATTEEG